MKLSAEQVEVLECCQSGDKWALTARDVQPVVTALTGLGYLRAEPTEMLVGGLYYRLTEAGRLALREREAPDDRG